MKLWRLATFNVNGIRARLPVVVEWLQERSPDLVCFQEIKCRGEDFPESAFTDLGYRCVWKGQKSFNGVAVLSKDRPERVEKNAGDEVLDREARFLAVQVHGIWVINTYVPQGRSPEDPAFQYKLDFFDSMRRWIESRFHNRSPLLWTGDFNVAPEPLDVFDPERLDGSVCFHPEERRRFREFLNWGFVDLYRRHHPETRQFTFWDYRLPKSVARNLGWRLDHILVTRPLAEASTECVVEMEPRLRPKPSDHTPVAAVFDLDRLS